MKSLDRLKADNPGLMTEIHEACLNKQAFLFVRDDAGWVLRPLYENGCVGVIIWVGWSDRRDGFVHYMPEIEKLARMIGARWLRYYSKRKGYLRTTKKLGWRQIDNDSGIEGAFCFQKTL